MHRFIVPPQSLGSGRLLLDKKESHHARDVLRVKPGEVVELMDGHGASARAVIAGFEDGRVALTVDKRRESPLSGPKFTVGAGVIKPERMEWMLEKCCELGASAWLPILTERSVVKISRERWQGKSERWRKIAQETCKQCGQSQVPEVREPESFKVLVKRIADYDLALLPTLAEPGPTLEEALLQNKKAQKVLFLIGPEGDFTPQEVRMAVEAGAVPVTLGALVLRSETAAVYTLSAARSFFASCALAGDKKK